MFSIVDSASLPIQVLNCLAGIQIVTNDTINHNSPHMVIKAVHSARGMKKQFQTMKVEIRYGQSLEFLWAGRHEDFARDSIFLPQANSFLKKFRTKFEG